MRYIIMVLLGILLFQPASASAHCWRTRGCFGCSGCYSSGCYGGYSRCYGSCHGWYGYQGCYGCHGCYGSCWGYTSGGYRSYCYGCAGGGGYGIPYWPGANTQPRAGTTRSSPYYAPGEYYDRKVKLDVIVEDPQAKFTIDGQATSSTGTLRHYESGELEPYRDFTYTVALQRNGLPAREGDTRTVYVKAGDRVVIDFTRVLSP